MAMLLNGEPFVIVIVVVDGNADEARRSSLACPKNSGVLAAVSTVIVNNSEGSHAHGYQINDLDCELVDAFAGWMICGVFEVEEGEKKREKSSISLLLLSFVANSTANCETTKNEEHMRGRK